MVVALTETDLGTKQQTKEWLERKFSDKTQWGRIWAEFWEKVELDAFILCPKESWGLALSIRVVNAEEVQGLRQAPVFGAASRYVGPAYVMENNKAIVAGGLSYINPKTGKPVTYAQAVHDGHFTKTGSWVPPNPFLTDAVARNLPYLDFLIDRYIKNEINKD